MNDRNDLDKSKEELISELSELRRLAGSLLSDVDALKLIHELEVHKLELKSQNEELNLAKEKAEEAREKAEAGDNLKTAFMQNISHELRTPLNGILGFGSLLSEPHLTIAEKEDYNKMLKASSDRLIRTINNYMDISLIATGNVTSDHKPVNILRMLKELHQRYQEPCEAKNVMLNLLLPENKSEYFILTDRELLEKIFSHLIENAIKFTVHGSINIGFSLKPGAAEFFVIDTGAGIADDIQARVFEPFFQEPVTGIKNQSGSGLGLSIIRGLITILGGGIRLESKKSKGTSFFFTLPSDEGIISEEIPISHPDQTLTAPLPVILIAEDDLYSDFFMETILQSKASVIFKATNGKKAVDLVIKHPEISIVLMDIKMPIMDGLEATKKIKSLRKDLPVIAITAYAFSTDRKKASEAGCDDFLPKPVSKEALLEILEKYTGTT